MGRGFSYFNAYFYIIFLKKGLNWIEKLYIHKIIAWFLLIIQSSILIKVDYTKELLTIGSQTLLLYFILLHSSILAYLFGISLQKNEEDNLNHTMFLGIYQVAICMTLSSISPLIFQLKMVANIIYVALPAFVIYELQKNKRD